MIKGCDLHAQDFDEAVEMIKKFQDQRGIGE